MAQLASVWDPWLVTRRPAKELVKISLRGRFFALVLAFRDGTRMRLLALPYRRHAVALSILRMAAGRHVALEEEAERHQ